MPGVMTGMPPGPLVPCGERPSPLPGLRSGLRSGDPSGDMRSMAPAMVFSPLAAAASASTALAARVWCRRPLGVGAAGGGAEVGRSRTEAVGILRPFFSRRGRPCPLGVRRPAGWARSPRAAAAI